MHSDHSHDFQIHLEFQKDSRRPERVFQSMSNLTLALKHFDILLAGSINREIQSHILLSDIKGGSIRSFFSSILKNIDDDDLRNINLHRIIGKFLVMGKHKVLNETNRLEKIESINDVTALIKIVENLKQEYEIYNSIRAKPISHRELLKILQEISNSIQYLDNKDSIVIIGEGQTTPFNKNFIITEEDIDTILTKKSDTVRDTISLMVKKPDYLGSSKWLCRSTEGQMMEIKILDKEWLGDFQKAQKILLPGDSIQAIVETRIDYDYQGNELNLDHSLIEVLDIIKGVHPIQLKLPYRK